MYRIVLKTVCEMKRFLQFSVKP